MIKLVSEETTFVTMRYLILLILVLCLNVAMAQSPLSSGFSNNHVIDRFEIQSGEFLEDIFTSAKPYRRDAVAKTAVGFTNPEGSDIFNQKYLLQDNMLWTEAPTRNPILKYFYKQENALFHVDEEDFKMQINPVLGFQYGNTSSDSLPMYRNSRGFELFGSIGNKVGFYSYALENQYRFPDFLRTQHDETRVIPGTTLHKNFGEEGEDFFNVAGHLTFSPIEQIMIQFGQDRNFIGNGYRSLILSDNTAPYPFVKVNTKVWKLNYQNLFMQHVDFLGQGENFRNPKKFSAFHHLSINLGKNVNIGMFENIIFDRSDSTGNGSFEFAYMNPIIFYRAVEHGLNSADNAVLGMDWKWNFKNHFSFYGQVIFDEFIKDQFFKATSTFANKWGYQTGFKYINVANISNLDLQLEVNQIRPYTLSHREKSQAWVHYNQPLAHPLGANFREFIGIVRYQPLDRLTLNLTAMSSRQGLDTTNVSSNFGGNILRPTTNLIDRNNVTLFQGIENNVVSVSFVATYMPWHNLFIDLGIYNRNVTNSFTGDYTTTIIHGGLRLNTAILKFD